MSSKKREEATKAAQQVLKLKKSIKELTEQLTEQIEIVRNYAAETGELRLGDAEIYEKKNPPKFVVSRSNVDLEKAIEIFLSKVPEAYRETKTSLKLSEILANQERDLPLKRALKQAGLKVEQDISFQIKSY